MRKNHIHHIDSIVEGAWQFIDRAIDKLWIPFLLASAFFLAVHGIIAAVR